MRYNPNDLVEYEPVEEGDYEFVVMNAEETTSQSGNEMIALALQVHVNGRKEPITVLDYLVNTPQSLWVLKDFCNAVSPRIDFDAGQLQAANCIGLTGTAHLVLGEENSKGKRYMEVERYIVPEENSGPSSTDEATRTEETALTANPSSQPPEQDDIPF